MALIVHCQVSINRMDVESLGFSSDSTRKVPSISVHQAEVALRLGKNLTVNLSFSLYASGFLRKVYGILTAQLCLTVIVCITCMISPTIKTFVQGRLVILL